MNRLKKLFSENPRELIMRGLGRLHSALVVAVVCCAVSEIMKRNAVVGYFRGLLFCIPMALSWYAVRSLKNMGQFLLASIGLMALTWLLIGNPGGAVAMGLVCFLRARARMSEETEKSYMDFPFFFMLIFFVLAFFISAILDLHVLQRASLISGAVYFLICVLYKGIGRIENYLYLNRDMKGMPTKRIVRTAGSAVLLAALIAAVLMIPVAVSSNGNFHVELPKNYTDPTESAEDYVGEVDSPGMDPSAFAELAKGGPTWQIPAFVSYIFFAVIGIILLVIIFNLIKSIITNFRLSYTDDGDVVQFLRGDRDDGDLAEEAKRERKPRIWDRSPNAAVRRRYRKEILRTAKSSPEGWRTPQEIESWAGVENQRLHELYEKARYGNTPCTDEDVKSLSK